MQCISLPSPSTPMIIGVSPLRLLRRSTSPAPVGGRRRTTRRGVTSASRPWHKSSPPFALSSIAAALRPLPCPRPMRIPMTSVCPPGTALIPPHRKILGGINVHGYEGTGGRRDLLYNAASSAGVEIWNSEYGDGDATGTQLAQNLLLDFNWLHPSIGCHPTAWTYWQAVDTTGWGLIIGDLEAAQLSTVEKKFFVLSRSLPAISARECASSIPGTTTSPRPTMRPGKSSSSWQPISTPASISTSISLSSVRRPRTARSSRAGRHTSPAANSTLLYSDTFMNGTKFWSYFDQNTVQTFEVSNVTL